MAGLAVGKFDEYVFSQWHVGNRCRTDADLLAVHGEGLEVFQSAVPVFPSETGRVVFYAFVKIMVCNIRLDFIAVRMPYVGYGGVLDLELAAWA